MADRNYAELDAIYARIPKLDCQRKCHTACGPIGMTHGESERLGPTSIDRGLSCSHLNPLLHTCVRYAHRPAICRLWGVVEGMECPFGCAPERLLTEAEGRAILHAITAWSGDGERFVYSLVPEGPL